MYEIYLSDRVSDGINKAVLFANMNGLYKSPEIVIQLTCRRVVLIIRMTLLSTFSCCYVLQISFCYGRLFSHDKPILLHLSLLFSVDKSHTIFV